jgi:phenylacetic acid degradation protein/carnitine operon protein CaiE
MIQWKTKGTELYQALPAEMRQYAKETLPLREVPADRALSIPSGYTTWKETHKQG